MAKKKQTTKNVDPSKIEEDELPSTLDRALAMGSEGIILKRVTDISELLDDEQSLITMVQTTASGGSIETVESRLGLPSGMLLGWLANGKSDTEAMRESLFATLYTLYRAALGEAQHAAELSLLAKSPAIWLDKVNPQRKIEDHAAEIPTVPAESNDEKPNESALKKDPKTGMGFKTFPSE